MKAIPTTYRGTHFRSRLEARWAEFFDLCGIAWEYEPEGYETSVGRYLPDFWLPRLMTRGRTRGAFFEVKPCSPTVAEQAKVDALVMGTGKVVLVPTSSPGHHAEQLSESVQYGDSLGELHVGVDEGLNFAKCPKCGQVDAGVYSSDEPTCPCGNATFNPYHPALEAARIAFPNLCRWEAA